LRTEVATSVPGELDDITPVIVAGPVWEMRYGAVVVVGLEVFPVQATNKGLAVVLPGAGMNVTVLVVIAAIVPVPDTVVAGELWLWSFADAEEAAQTGTTSTEASTTTARAAARVAVFALPMFFII
jgi:hypothetical protein